MCLTLLRILLSKFYLDFKDDGGPPFTDD